MFDSLSIGVLALQGDFHLHLQMLSNLGVKAVPVRKGEQLQGLDGLVFPGGESSTMLKLMEDTTMEADLIRFSQEGGTLFGTCAGAILLAAEVEPKQRSLGLIDIAVSRNAYGRQIDSFETDLPWMDGEPLRAVFIRAPKIGTVGPSVRVLLEHGGEPVLVEREDHGVLVATFHPEATADRRLHQLFLSHVQKRQTRTHSETSAVS